MSKSRARPESPSLRLAGLLATALIGAVMAIGLRPAAAQQALVPRDHIIWRSAPGLTSDELDRLGASAIDFEGYVRRRHERGNLVTYWRHDAGIYRCIDRYLPALGFYDGYCDRAETDQDRWGDMVDRAIREGAPNGGGRRR